MAAVEDWTRRTNGEPERMFTYIAGCASGGDTLERTMERAREYRSIGDWAAYKCSDLSDACLNASIDQSDSHQFLYKTPEEGLLMMAAHWGFDMSPHYSVIVDQAYNRLGEELSDLTAPHKPGTPIDAFTRETIACKWKSHMGGHYPPSKDLREIADGLRPWAQVCESAGCFLTAMPNWGQVDA